MKLNNSIFRYLGFVPVGYVANTFLVSVLGVFIAFSVGWDAQDVVDQGEKIMTLSLLLDLPGSILGYKISHIIKPANLTNKNFINIHFFIIGLKFAYGIGKFFWFDSSISPLNLFLSLLIEIGVFTLMIKDRKFNLFNLGL